MAFERRINMFPTRFEATGAVASSRSAISRLHADSQGRDIQPFHRWMLLSTASRGGLVDDGRIHRRLQ